MAERQRSLTSLHGPGATLCECFPTFLRGIRCRQRETGLNDTSRKLLPFVTDGFLRPERERDAPQVLSAVYPHMRLCLVGHIL